MVVRYYNYYFELIIIFIIIDHRRPNYCVQAHFCIYICIHMYVTVKVRKRRNLIFTATYTYLYLHIYACATLYKIHPIPILLVLLFADYD